MVCQALGEGWVLLYTKVLRGHENPRASAGSLFLEAGHQEHISQISISNSLMLNRCWLNALVNKLGCWNFQQAFGLDIPVI